MYRIVVLNRISSRGIELLDSDQFQLSKDLDGCHAILVRSQKIEAGSLGESIMAIGRAGAGVNNIPVDYCTQKGIVVFNTPGANANAVKELVFAGLFLSARNILPSLTFLNDIKESEDVLSLAEASKSKFVGSELLGKTIGVIGLGEIGRRVAIDAENLGLKVLGFDPYLTNVLKKDLSNRISLVEDLDSLISKGHYISLHMPLNRETRNMFNREKIDLMRGDGVLLNFARPELVSEPDLIDYLKAGSIRSYVTDFPSKSLLACSNVIGFPHLGASTVEAEENCSVMISENIREFLLNGNISHSVNFPDCKIERNGSVRLCIINDNVPNVVGQIATILAKNGININDMVNKSKNDMAYTIVDFDGVVPDDLLANLRFIESVRKVRLL